MEEKAGMQYTLPIVLLSVLRLFTGNEIDKVRQQNTFWHRKLTSYIMKRKLYKNIRFMWESAFFASAILIVRLTEIHFLKERIVSQEQKNISTKIGISL